MGTVAPPDEKRALADELAEARALVEEGDYDRALSLLTGAREQAQVRGDREALGEVRRLARLVCRRAPRGSDVVARADVLVLAVVRDLTLRKGGAATAAALEGPPVPVGAFTEASASSLVLDARSLLARSKYEEALGLLEQAKREATTQGDTRTLREISTVAQVISIQTSGSVRRTATRLHQTAAEGAYERALHRWQLLVVIGWLVATAVVGAVVNGSDWFPRSFWIFLALLFFGGVAYCVYGLGVLIFWAAERRGKQAEPRSPAP